MRQLQRNLGPIAGARRYVEIIALVDAYIHFGVKCRQHFCLLGLARRSKQSRNLKMIEELMLAGAKDVNFS